MNYVSLVKKIQDSAGDEKVIRVETELWGITIVWTLDKAGRLARIARRQWGKDWWLSAEIRSEMARQAAAVFKRKARKAKQLSLGLLL